MKTLAVILSIIIFVFGMCFIGEGAETNILNHIYFGVILILFAAINFVALTED